MAVQQFSTPRATPWGTKINAVKTFDDADAKIAFVLDHANDWTWVARRSNVQGTTIANIYLDDQAQRLLVPTSYDGGLYVHYLAD